MKRTSYDFIDLVKLTASIMIFAMHGTVFHDFGDGQLIFEIGARWGVPFFFICSSFFLFDSGETLVSKARIVRYTKRIALLYAVWFIVNSPQVFYSRIYLNGLFSVRTYIDFIKSIFFSSTYTGSWYLVSSIYAAWIIYLFSKRWKTEYILLLTFFTQLICIFSSAYNGVLPASVASLLSGKLGFLQNIFGGCFYFAIGKYISEHRNDITERCSLIVYILLAVILYFLYFAEMITVISMSGYTGSDASFMVIPTAVVLFIICLKVKLKLPEHLILRKISTIIYCGQGNVLIAKSVVSKLLRVKSSVLSFVCAMVIMAALIVFVLQSQKHSNNKWIQILT